MTFISLPLAGVNLERLSVLVVVCVCVCGLLFALADVPENSLSLHRSISHLSDKRLGRAATCASLWLRSQWTAGGREESGPAWTGCRMMEGKGGKPLNKMKDI